MKARSNVRYTYEHVEITILVEHDPQADDATIEDKAATELSFIHDIDVRHLGAWTFEVIR